VVQVYVREEGEDLHDATRRDRQPIDFLDIRILALFDEKPFHSTYLIADALGVSHSAVLSMARSFIKLIVRFARSDDRADRRRSHGSIRNSLR
jgi:hypothetical protein